METQAKLRIQRVRVIPLVLRAKAELMARGTEARSGRPVKLERLRTTVELEGRWSPVELKGCRVEA